MKTISVKERREKLTSAFERLLAKDGILPLLKLRARSSLSRFSLGNILWLLGQAFIRDLPMPTMLLTFEAWKVHDRHVRKRQPDEPSFYWTVLHPVRKSLWIDPLDESKGKHPVIVGWGLTYEYDVSDTEGQPLPELASTPDLDSDAHLEELLSLIEWTIYEEDIPVHWSDRTGSAKGWYDRKDKSITLSEGLSPDEALCVLVHELVHALCDTNYHDFTRQDSEAITEFAACIVVMGMDLDHLSQSIEYCAGWQCDDPKRALLLLDKAEDCARRIEVALSLRSIYESKEKAA